MRLLGIATSAGVLVVALGAAPVACGSGFTAGPSDAGSDGSMTVDGPGAETSSDDATEEIAEGGDSAASGHIVYVSPGGSDLVTGLDPAHPKKSITSALVEAKLLTGLPEIHACAGTYTEDGILVAFDVVLKGAYDCTTWMQTATYGYPKPDGVNTTTIATPDTTTQEAAVVVTGPVTHATVIDGFTINGAPTTTAHTDGVRVTGSASPVLSNDVIAGGSGQVAASVGTTGSIGILVDLQAAPEIEDCIVSGGLGRGTVGSAGVELDSTGGVSLHDSTITGGTGQAVSTGGTAAIGIDVRTSLTTPLTALFAGGTDAAGTMGESIGIRVAGTGVTTIVTASYIEGGIGLDTTAESIGMAINTPGGGTTLSADRVYGGYRTAGTAQQTLGILVAAAGSFTLENTLVHGGTVQSTTGAFTVGVDLSAVAAPVIAFDTIYTGAAAGTAIAINAGVTAAVIRDDLLLGSDASGGAIAVATTQCGGGVIGALDNTAFGNAQTLYQCGGGGGTDQQSAADLAGLSLDLGAAESNNVAVQATCIALDDTCAKFAGCPGAAATCLPGIFGMTWSSDDGLSALFGSSAPDGGVPIQGWTLVPGTFCDITTGGAQYGGVTTDGYGNKRNATTPTMGAVEYTSTTKCSAN